jgi:hypothetical protein
MIAKNLTTRRMPSMARKVKISSTLLDWGEEACYSRDRCSSAEKRSRELKRSPKKVLDILLL